MMVRERFGRYQYTLSSGLFEVQQEAGVCHGGFLRILHRLHLVLSHSLLLHSQLRPLCPQLRFCLLHSTQLLLHLPEAHPL